MVDGEHENTFVEESEEKNIANNTNEISFPSFSNTLIWDFFIIIEIQCRNKNEKKNP